MEATETAQSQPKKVVKHYPGYDPDSEIISPRHVRLIVGVSAITIWRFPRVGGPPLDEKGPTDDTLPTEEITDEGLRHAKRFAASVSSGGYGTGWPW